MRDLFDDSDPSFIKKGRKTHIPNSNKGRLQRNA